MRLAVRALVLVLPMAVAACSTTTTVIASPSTPSMTESPIPIPTPTAPATPPLQRPEIRGPFSEHGWIMGKRLGLGMGTFSHPDHDCAVHTYKAGGKTRGAFQSDCASWESNGYDILIFYVSLRNNSGHSVQYGLRDFVLVTRDGRSYGPVNVRSKAQIPPNFLPETGKITPRTNLRGYLTFDGRATGVVPARLSYVDGDQTLTVVFDGRPGMD